MEELRLVATEGAAAALHLIEGGYLTISVELNSEFTVHRAMLGLILSDFVAGESNSPRMTVRYRLAVRCLVLRSSATLEGVAELDGLVQLISRPTRKRKCNVQTDRARATLAVLLGNNWMRRNSDVGGGLSQLIS